jgi:hypothetical protein
MASGDTTSATGWGALALVLGMVGCTELAPGTDTLAIEGLGPNQPDAAPTVDPGWSCLDVPTQSVGNGVVPNVELTLALIDTISGTPPEGLSARACAKRDVDCATPLSPPTSVAVDGAVHLTVPQTFDGFVEITSPSTVSTMYFLNRELMRDGIESFGLVTQTALGALAMGGNVTLDPALGHMLIRAFDCEGEPAGGVQISNDKGGLPFTFINGLPVPGRDVTVADGLGGYVNVPVGFAVVQGIRVEGSRLLGTANVVVRRGWFTYGDVEPLPEP